MLNEENEEITSYTAIKDNEGEPLSSSANSVKSSTLEKSPVEHITDQDSNQERNVADNSEESNNDLENRRQLIKTLLNDRDWQEGDNCVVIPKSFLDSFFDDSATSLEDLREKIGPIDFQSIVDHSGFLFSTESEHVATIGISNNIYQHLSDWFKIKGQPVRRPLITNTEKGILEIERWPPMFWIHYVGKKTHQPTYFRSGYTRHNNHSNPENEDPVYISISRNNTFKDLLEFIRDQVVKAPRRSIDDFRLWFISGNKENELSYMITATNFVYKIPNKNVVPPTIYSKKLASEGVDKSVYHLVVEYKEKSNLQFPIDAFVQSHASTLSDSKDNFGGHMGLSNLGNTCYMNSALQCLLHVPEINQYFFHNIYQKELNSDNPLGYNGDVANAFGSLLKQAFDPAKASSSMSPREFKHTIGRYSSMFSGYLQQDSQELLSWLLDALHEDLNRIQKKPYCEKPELKDDEVDDKQAIARLSETCWNQHKQRNDSVITDLFTGLYESILVCPDCGKTSITFDPFNDLTLPLPINKKWYHTFTIVDLSPDGKLANRIMKLEVELKTTSNYDDLVKYLSNFLSVARDDLYLYEVFQHGIYADFQKNNIKNKFLPISEIIKDADDVVVYIIPHDPESEVVIPVFNVVQNDDTSYRMGNYFGIPLFITLKKDQLNSFGAIRQKLLEAASVLTNVDLIGEYEAIKQNNENYTEKKFYSKSDFPLITSMGVEGEEETVGENGYDSDVSLANPYVDADFGFKIKYIYDSTHEIPSSKYRSSFSSNNSFGTRPTTTVHVPLHKPAISNYKVLSDQLPPSKRSYYHSLKGNSGGEKAPIEDDNAVDDITEEGKHAVVDDYLISRSTTPMVLPLGRDEWSDNEAVVSIDEGDEEPQPQQDVAIKSESASDAGETNSTFEQGFAPNLPPRNQQYSHLTLSDTESEGMLGSSSFMPPQTGYPDSTKPSNINSPLETNFADEEAQESHSKLVTRNSILLCDWNKDVYSKLFGDPVLITWDSNSIPQLVNQELAVNKARFERQRKSKITLVDCLKSFSTPEVLGEHDLWYCPRCKDHKRATKSIQIWSTGDILTIHLKRFHSARAFSDKIDIVVDFPIEGLDIGPYVANPTIQEKDCIYDLIAVDNHYGGLGGGHYTASVKNFKDDKWYYFNDSRVTEISNTDELISSAAYLLFYRRRRPANESLGGEGLRDILKRGEEEYKLKAIEKQVAITDLQNSIERYYTALRFNQNQDGEVDYESEEKLNGEAAVDDKSSSEEDEVSRRARRQRVLSKEGDDGVSSLRHSNSKRQKMNSSPPEDADISSENSDGSSPVNTSVVQADADKGVSLTSKGVEAEEESSGSELV